MQLTNPTAGSIIKAVRQPIDGLPYLVVEEITAKLWSLGGYFFFVILITSEMIATTRVNRARSSLNVMYIRTALPS